LLVKAHHDNGRAKPLHLASMAQKHFLALFQRDGVDNALALNTFQSGLYHFPVTGIYHHRHTGNVGFGGNEIQEIGHLLRRLQQAVVHVYVYDDGPVFYLSARDHRRLIILLLFDESQKLARAGHIASLAHVHEIDFGGDIQQVQARKPSGLGSRGRHMRLLALSQQIISVYEFFCRSAAAAYDIDQTFVNILGYLGRHALGCLIILPQRVGQPGIGIGRNIIRSLAGKLFEEWFHLARAK